MCGAILARKHTIGTLEKMRGEPGLLDNMESVMSGKIWSRGTKTRESDGGNHLTAEQVAQFERDGVIGPIKVMERNEALALGEWVEEMQERKWDVTVSCKCWARPCKDVQGKTETRMPNGWRLSQARRLSTSMEIWQSSLMKLTNPTYS